jgi:thiamine-monophosphate kinase
MSVEWDQIRRIAELSRATPASAADGREASTGLAELDDCAVVPFDNGVDLVIGSDFVRGEGFYLFGPGLLDWEAVGYYLIAANASDLAAMGATPTGAVVVFRVPTGMSMADHDATMSGVLRACAEFGMPLLGGDSGGYALSVLSAAAFGTCPSGRALLRRNGRPGEAVYLSGDIGTAAAAVAWFLRGREAGAVLDGDVEESLLAAWRRPQPALELGRLLTAEGLSACAIDTSDGLKAAARQLAEASAADVVFEPDAIPISHEAHRVAEAMGLDPLALAAGDSVDFRLLFTVPGGRADGLEAAVNRAGLTVHQVGRMTKAIGKPGAFLEVAGERAPMPGIEWDHSEQMTIDRLFEEQGRGQ